MSKKSKIVPFNEQQFGTWGADRMALWPMADSGYLIGRDRFSDTRNLPNRLKAPADYTDTLPGWINHLRGKTWFTPQSELDFLRAYIHMCEQPDLTQTKTELTAHNAHNKE